LSTFSPIDKSNETAKEKAVNLQRPANRNNETCKHEAVYLQRPISSAHMLLSAVHPGSLF
jgi:hypothetical protein